jgi:hypothetical protein
MEDVNNLPITSSLEVGKVSILYTKGKGFTYTTPDNWSGKRFANWQKKYKKHISKTIDLLWDNVNKR